MKEKIKFEDVMRMTSEINPLILKEIEKHIPRKGEPQILFDGIWDYIERGGKRLRPLLIALSYQAIKEAHKK